MEDTKKTAGGKLVNVSGPELLPSSGDMRRISEDCIRCTGWQHGGLMQSHEVLREVLRNTSAKQIAGDMSLSLSLIYKWAEPPVDDSGSGANSPLDRIGQLIRSSQDPRIAQWVCEQAGGFYIRNPESLHHTGPLNPLTNDIVQEFADMLATIAKAAADNTITTNEAKTIRRRWEDLKSVTERFVHAAEIGRFGDLAQNS